MNEAIKAAELLAASIQVTLEEAEARFAYALDWLKTAIKAHAEAEITLMYVKLQRGRTN